MSELDALAQARDILRSLERHWPADAVARVIIELPMLRGLADRLEAAEDEHDQCPAQCPVCGDWATRTPCDHCKGSGCGPGTALGGYEECEWCAGMGWLHEGCRDTGPSWQERAETERDEAREEQR